eukprot:PLAT15145.1.p1 GENE.PLAT15145.1~~PLAT15145.1.p1  ORF type:complete len:360 (+),score=42.48 PLAT15145.1:44-1123(+)
MCLAKRAASPPSRASISFSPTSTRAPRRCTGWAMRFRRWSTLFKLQRALTLQQGGGCRVLTRQGKLNAWYVCFLCLNCCLRVWGCQSADLWVQGRKVRLRSDWEEVKVDVMSVVVRDKFTRDDGLREKLLATGDALLVEGNNWNDRFWGRCKGKGENWLGRILMAARSDLADGTLAGPVDEGDVRLGGPLQPRAAGGPDSDDSGEEGGKEGEKREEEEDFLREVRGDLFDCPSVCSLAHCVSADLKMGKGIARQFKRKYAGLPELRRQKVAVGGVAVLRREDRQLYYLVTKARARDLPTYDSLTQSLEEMKAHALSNGVRDIAMPTIGCGLDALNWKRVRTILKRVFTGTGIRLTVYSL